MPNLTLVLDLDETLVHAAPAGDLHAVNPIGVHAPYVILPRPGLASFLDWISPRFDVVIWSASHADYVGAVTEMLAEYAGFVPDLVLSAAECVPRFSARPGEPLFRKELQSLRARRVSPRRTVCVDNFALSFERDLRNLIEVAPFRGEPEDGELELLRRFLGELLELPYGRDVRRLELRTWREQVRR